MGHKRTSRRLDRADARLAVGVAVVVWTALVGGALLWGLRRTEANVLKSALTQARTTFARDVLYRSWAAGHGGVYVPETQTTPANARLAHVPERDLVTPSGRRLTLMNPAYITRQVHASDRARSGVRSHITSLEPIYEGNAADAWETRALRAIEAGASEYHALVQYDGEPHMRLMSPLRTEKGCLRCHAEHGYEEGSVRGGISVSVPMAPHEATLGDQRLTLVLSHAAVWGLGLAGLGLWIVRGRARERELRQRALVATRTAEVRQVASTLRDSEQHMSSIFRAAPVGVGLVSNRIIKRVNRKVCEMVGRSPEELIDKSARIFYPSDEEYERVGRVKYAMIRERGTGTIETVWRHGEGQLIDVLLSSTPIDPDDLSAGVTFTALDITFQMNVETRLRRSRDRLLRVQEAIGLGIVEWDLGTNTVELSDHARRLLGLEDIDEKPTLEDLLELAEPGERQAIRLLTEAAARGDVRVDETHRYVRPDGSVVWIHAQGDLLRDADGKPAKLLGTLLDVTGMKQLELELMQSQRMEAVGRLAGGIAHDFNNLLTVIGGYGDIVLARLEEEHPLYPKVTEIVRAAARAGDLTRQLLAFSRRQVLAPRKLDLNTVLLDMEKMLRRLIGEDVLLVTRPGKDLRRVWADPAQLEQVIVNLAVNARDAMPGGGSLSFETRNVDQRGRYVQLTVTDSGEGMSDEVRSRIFEPFFSTKEHGKGTGLGLSTVYGIVKQSGGEIAVNSAPGQGTRFVILLPAAGAEDEEEGEGAKDAVPGGSETVLLVEDEAGVRGLAAEIIESAGYTVLEADNGEAALRLARDHEGVIDVLVTDMVMPGLGGTKLAQALREARPEAKVLFMTGYTEETVPTRGPEHAGRSLLDKPFTSETLLRAVRAVLDGNHQA
jgi:PAS domain S-box-containing protein